MRELRYKNRTEIAAGPVGYFRATL